MLLPEMDIRFPRMRKYDAKQLLKIELPAHRKYYNANMVSIAVSRFNLALLLANFNIRLLQ